MRTSLKRGCLVAIAMFALTVSPLASGQETEGNAPLNLAPVIGLPSNAISRALDAERNVDAITKAISAGNLSPEAEAALRSRRAFFLLGAQDPDKALADLDAAIQLRPNDGDAYGRRAMAYLAKGDAVHSASDAEEALRLNPDAVLGHFVRGWLAAHSNRGGEAVADFDATVRLAPNQFLGYWGLSTLDADAGEW